MVRQASFSKNEREILPGYRQRIKQSESCADAGRLFAHTVSTLLVSASGGRLSLRSDEVTLQIDASPYFTLAEELLAADDFLAIWQNSDLPKVLGRLAETAANHCRHLRKHPEKTDAKIRK